MCEAFDNDCYFIRFQR